MQLFILQRDSVHQGSIWKYNTSSFYFFFTLWLWIFTYTEREHKIHYIYIYKRLDPLKVSCFKRTWMRWKGELDSLVAHRKQTSSSGNQILFKLGTLRESKAVKEGFENVFWSHRECWPTPSNLQTNKTGRLEVKLAVNVWPPYI